MFDAINFGKRLRKARVAKGLMQKALAEHIDIAPQVLSAYENGKSTPSVETLLALADYLGVSVDGLLGRKEIGEYTLGDAARILLDLYQRGDCKIQESTYDNGYEKTPTATITLYHNDDLRNYLVGYQRLKQLKKDGLITADILSQWETGLLANLDKAVLRSQDKPDYPDVVKASIVSF